MAGIVDTSTGKIIGVKKGSLSWWHEKGHIVFAKSEKGIRAQYWNQQFLLYTIFSGVFALFWLPFRWGAISMIFFWAMGDIYEELWCWKYAYWKKDKNK